MTDAPERKPFIRLPPLPDEVFADPGRNDWYFRERKPDSVARYVRADLVKSIILDAQLRAFERRRLDTPDEIRAAAFGVKE